MSYRVFPWDQPTISVALGRQKIRVLINVCEIQAITPTFALHPFEFPPVAESQDPKLQPVALQSPESCLIDCPYEFCSFSQP